MVFVHFLSREKKLKNVLVVETNIVITDKHKSTNPFWNVQQLVKPISIMAKHYIRTQ